MTTTEKPRRPIARPAGIAALAVLLLFVSGFVYSLTGWTWLGGVNLVLLIVGGLAGLWTVAVALVLLAATIVGKTRHR